MSFSSLSQKKIETYIQFLDQTHTKYMFKIFLQLILVDVKKRQAPIPCANLAPRGWILYDDTSVLCDDDGFLTILQFNTPVPSKTNIFVASTVSLTSSTCLPNCTVCFNNDKNKCLYCAGSQRGPEEYVQIGQLVARNRMSLQRRIHRHK
ncbi:hypothetical protein pb186bvf_017016 [Paramecium bursaria]